MDRTRANRRTVLVELEWIVTELIVGTVPSLAIYKYGINHSTL